MRFFVLPSSFLQGDIAMAFHHNNTAGNEPGWSDVDKTALPRLAFADQGESDKKS